MITTSFYEFLDATQVSSSMKLRPTCKFTVVNRNAKSKCKNSCIGKLEIKMVGAVN